MLSNTPSISYKGSQFRRGNQMSCSRGFPCQELQALLVMTRQVYFWLVDHFHFNWVANKFKTVSACYEYSGITHDFRNKLVLIHFSICTKADAAAIIGAVTISGGLVAASLSESKSPIYQPLTEGSSNVVVSYHKADHFSAGKRSLIAWNIAKNNGEVYCWVVPCSSVEHKMNADNIQKLHTELGLKLYSEIGQLCYLGESSLWMNGSSTTENEIAFGQCTNPFACNLFAGQRSRNITTSGPPISSFHLSNCIIGPPPSTSLLYLSLLTLATKVQDCSTGSSNKVSQQKYIASSNDVVSHPIA